MHNMYKQEWRRLVMCHWCAFFAGEKAKLEAERERLVHMKELETQKQQAEELRHLVMEVLFQPFYGLWIVFKFNEWFMKLNCPRQRAYCSCIGWYGLSENSCRADRAPPAKFQKR